MAPPHAANYIATRQCSRRVSDCLLLLPVFC